MFLSLTPLWSKASSASSRTEKEFREQVGGLQSEPGDVTGGSPYPLNLFSHSVEIIFHSKPPSVLYFTHLIRNRVNCANELCKITVPTFSVKSFLRCRYIRDTLCPLCLSYHQRGLQGLFALRQDSGGEKTAMDGSQARVT